MSSALPLISFFVHRALFSSLDKSFIVSLFGWYGPSTIMGPYAFFMQIEIAAFDTAKLKEMRSPKN